MQFYYFHSFADPHISIILSKDVCFSISYNVDIANMSSSFSTVRYDFIDAQYIVHSMRIEIQIIISLSHHSLIKFYDISKDI